MKCARCPKSIRKSDMARAHFIYDDEGALISAFHHKCWHIAKRQADLEQSGRTNAPDIHTAVRRTSEDVQMEALRKRQKEIAEEREKEPRPEAWADWRDPGSIDI